MESCTSADSQRHILNGVLFTPEEGGRVVATDGKRLAAAPAAVPAMPFVLPAAALKVLCHPGLRGRAFEVTTHAEAPEAGREETVNRVCFRCGPHTLVSPAIDGNYPEWRQVVPRDMVASVTVAEASRAGLVGWLRGLRERDAAVILSRGKRHTLRVAHTAPCGASGLVEVPAAITGEPAVVALAPAFLADALEIAPVLWITDELTPVVARRADGLLCVVMPRRVPAGVQVAAQAAA